MIFSSREGVLGTGMDFLACDLQDSAAKRNPKDGSHVTPWLEQRNFRQESRDWTSSIRHIEIPLPLTGCSSFAWNSVHDGVSPPICYRFLPAVMY